MSFKAAEQRKLIKQLREKADSLKQSRDECAKSFELCNSGLADMRAEVKKAKDLAGFYEKQAAENEMLAALFRQVLIALAECKVDISDLTLVPDKIKQLVTVKNSSMQLLKENGIVKGEVTVIDKAEIESVGLTEEGLGIKAKILESHKEIVKGGETDDK